MAKCIVKSCCSKGVDLFCAPEDKRKLKLWQNILKTEENEFLICSVHFERRFVGVERFLTQNAFPSILIEPEEAHGGTKACQACLQTFEAEAQKHAISINVRQIFYSTTGYKLKLGEMICAPCYQQFTDFEFFVTDLKGKHDALMKQMKLQKRKENNHQAARKPTNHFDPLKSADQSDLYNSHDGFGDQNGADENEMSEGDDDVVELPSAGPEVHEIFDDEEDEDSQDVTNHFDPSENLVVTVDPDAMYENKDNFYQDHGFPDHFLDFADTPGGQRRLREPVTCRICHEIFPSIVGLKIHEQKMHNRRSLPTMPILTPPPQLQIKDSFTQAKQNKVQCANCDESFKSYYHLQKHRDREHFESLAFKCRFPYCRTRAETREEINAHYSKFHEGVSPPPVKKRKKKRDEVSD